MKPICQVCGERHESYQAHVFRKVSVANASPVVANAVANGSTKDRHKKTPERRRYMRELMQALRALKSGRAEPWKNLKNA